MRSIGAAIAAFVAGVAALAFAKRDSASSSGCSVAALRARVVDIAKGEAGLARLNVYFADAAPQFVNDHPNWCGIFALWCLRQVGLTKKQWVTGKGFLLTAPAMPQTNDPQPGDIAYYERYQHQAVVLSNNGDGTVTLANGNGTGGVVSIGTRPITDAAAYYSIRRMCDEFVAKGCA